MTSQPLLYFIFVTFALFHQSSPAVDAAAVNYNTGANFASRMRRGVVQTSTTLWTDGVIPYKLDNYLMTSTEKILFEKAIKAIQQETCVVFRPYDSRKDKNYVEVVNQNRCFSEIGMRKGRQSLILSKSCRSMGMMMHELVHTVGQLHELSRPDRDEYVDFYSENIQPGRENEFRKKDSQRVSSYGDPFDFQSITLYLPSDFSKNGKPTFYPKASLNYTLALRPVHLKDLSFYDVKIINKMYNCDAKCPGESHCPSGQFRDKHCRCVGPADYARKRCQDDPDKTDYCLKALKMGSCFHDDQVVPAYCRKTCGACFRHENEGSAPMPPEVCIDLDSANCPNLVANGFCFFDDYTIHNCQKSCQTCVSHKDSYISDFTCRDGYSPYKCQSWAKEGLCDRDRSFMHSSCARTCKVCQPKEGEKNQTASGTPRLCSNVLSDKVCQEKARRYLCTHNPTQMRRDCPLFCGACPTIQDNCQDEADAATCQNMLYEEECANNLPKALLRCRKSCGLCKAPMKSSSDIRTDRPMRMTAATRKATPATTKTPANAIKTTVNLQCQNKAGSTSCDAWARVGYCKSSYVKKNCQKSCNLC